MHLTPVDVGLLLLVFMSGVWGLMSGAIRLTAPFAVLLTGLTILHTYPDFSTTFGDGMWMRSALVLLLAFAALVVYGFAVHALAAAVRLGGMAPLDRLLGLVLGLVTGVLLAGGAVWALETFASAQSVSILDGSAFAPAARTFFESLLSLTERFLPRPSVPPASVPWWKRPIF